MGAVEACKGLWGRFGAQFVRFFVVGVGATLLHWAVYIGLNSLFGITEADALAYTTTFTIGYIVSFVGNYIVSLRWTFKTKGSCKKGLGFAFSHLVNWGMQAGLLRLLIYIGVGAWMGGCVASLLPALAESCPRLVDPTTLVLFPVYCIVVPMNFLLVRFFLTRGDGEVAQNNEK